MSKYQRHFLETPIDFQQRKVRRSWNKLIILYWVAIALILVSISVGVWIVSEVVKK